MKIENAVILAAGLSSRFAPLSDICPKAMFPVRGEGLIERQIRQLLEAGIRDISLVTGYQGEKFQLLKERYGVRLIENPEYASRNNHSSIYAAREVLGNTYICCADNYFPENPFSTQAEGPFYSALYCQGETEEWCMETDSRNRIVSVTVGGRDAWHMFGHVLWDEAFTRRYLSYLEAEYPLPKTRTLYWEDIYIRHIDQLCLYLNPCPAGSILEFDTLADLAAFDPFYQGKTNEELCQELTRWLLQE